MLKSFSVRNFRCLEDLELHNLARVNLLVGDNNAGKTALLEAFFAHLVQSNALALIQLKAFRGPITPPDERFWQEFFTGMDDSREIHLSSVDSDGKERKSKIAVGPSAQVTLAVPGVTGGITEGPGRSPQTVTFRPLRVEYKDAANDEPLTNEISLDSSSFAFSQRHPTSPDLRAYYFSTAGPPGAESVAKHVSDLLVSKREEALLRVAKAIDERIRSVSVASPRGTSEVFVDVGERQLLPLTLLGSGVIRTIGIASAIPVHPNGLVLVDELENGIYYKRLPELWRNVYEIAKVFGVQIIATTHSSECVSAAIQAVTADLRDSDPIHIYRLVRGRRRPIPYERNDLQSALEFTAEMR